MDLEKYPHLARLVSSCETNGGTVKKTKKHRPYPIRLLDWSRTFKWMLDINKIEQLDIETKTKIKNVLEQMVLPYLNKLKS